MIQADWSTNIVPWGLLIGGEELHNNHHAYPTSARFSIRASTIYAMRRELPGLWRRSAATREQLVRQLQEWCRRAEASGIAQLAEFSQRLRSYA